MDYGEDKTVSGNDVDDSVVMHDVGTAMAAITDRVIDRAIDRKEIAFRS